MVGEAAVAVRLGVVLTVTVAVCAALQPELVPVTVYTVVTVGVTLIVEVVGPVFHEYVVAPAAVSVAGLPEQTVALFTVTVGVAFTFTETVRVLVHPLLLPVTVYTEVAAGETLTLAVVAPPGDQV